MRIPCHRRGHSRGLLLVELVIVLGIVAILMAIAVPSLKTLLSSTQLTTAKNALVQGLQRARAEAVSSGRDVVLCPSADERSCSDDNDWSSGWLLYRDDNRNGRFDPVEPLLLSQALDSSLVSVRSNAGRRRITYRNLGESAGANATFTICSRRVPDHGGQVIVANSGRVRSLNYAPDSACTAD